MSLSEAVRQAAAMVERTNVTAWVYRVGPVTFDFTVAPLRGRVPVAVIE